MSARIATAMLLGAVAAGCSAGRPPTPAPALTPPTTPIEVDTWSSMRLTPASPCPDRYLEGRLVQHAEWILALRDDAERAFRVVWPDGTFARYSGVSGVDLFVGGHFAGTTSGSRLRVRGSDFGADGWLACGAIERRASM